MKGVDFLNPFLLKDSYFKHDKFFLNTLSISSLTKSNESHQVNNELFTDRFERPKHDNDSGKHDNDSDKDSIERLEDYNERPKHDNDSVKDANESYKDLNDSPEDNAAPLTAYIS